MLLWLYIDSLLGNQSQALQMLTMIPVFLLLIHLAYVSDTRLERGWIRDGMCWSILVAKSYFLRQCSPTLYFNFHRLKSLPCLSHVRKMLLIATSDSGGRILRCSCYMVSDKRLKSSPIQKVIFQWKKF